MVLLTSLSARKGCLERSSPSWADRMAVFWVHPLFTLPVIWEHFGMGDEPPPRRRPLEAVEQLGKFNGPGRCFCLSTRRQVAWSMEQHGPREPVALDVLRPDLEATSRLTPVRRRARRTILTQRQPSRAPTNQARRSPFFSVNWHGPHRASISPEHGTHDPCPPALSISTRRRACLSTRLSGTRKHHSVDNVSVSAPPSVCGTDEATI